MSINPLEGSITVPKQQSKPTNIKLGLIGNGIARSKAPRLHQIAGRMYGLELSYDLIDLQDHDPACFESVLAKCAAEGYRGVNVTYPFKERAAQLIEIPSPAVQQVGSVNTVIFSNSSPPQGYNTDYSGFLRAFRQRFPNQMPGAVGLVGTGGVGRAVAFGLLELGASFLNLYDLSLAKAKALATSLKQANPQLTVRVCHDVYQLTKGVAGTLSPCRHVSTSRHPHSACSPKR